MSEFVSFELAKKLKQKGFACKYPFAMYNESGCFCALYTSADRNKNIKSVFGNREYYDYDDFDEHDCIAPTIGQVLKWLRDEHSVSVQPLTVRGGLWDAQVTFTDNDNEVLKAMFEDKSVWSDELDSYEEAAIAGIELALNYLGYAKRTS